MESRNPLDFILRLLLLAACAVIFLACCVACQTKRVTVRDSSTVTQLSHCHTQDTLVLRTADTLIVRDTMTGTQQLIQTDSVTDRISTYVVVDTSGHILERVVYRDRQVYHNRDALASSSHTATTSTTSQQTAKSTTSTSKDSLVNISTTYARKTRTTFRTYLAVALVFISFASVLYYLFVYRKRK